MQTYKRINANIPEDLYVEIKYILKDQDRSITEFITESMRKLAAEYKMMKMVDIYNKVAEAQCTEESVKWDESCSSDGLI